jgi:hypothetical protein
MEGFTNHLIAHTISRIRPIGNTQKPLFPSGLEITVSSFSAGFVVEAQDLAVRDLAKFRESHGLPHLGLRQVPSDLKKLTVLDGFYASQVSR